MKFPEMTFSEIWKEYHKLTKYREEVKHGPKIPLNEYKVLVAKIEEMDETFKPRLLDFINSHPDLKEAWYNEFDINKICDLLEETIKKEEKV